MNEEFPNLIFKGKQLRKYRHIRRKYPVSSAFLKTNLENLKCFLRYALKPQVVLRSYVLRRRHNRVFIAQRPQKLFFDPRQKRTARRCRKNVKEWSQRLVSYYKAMGQIQEYEEMEIYGVAEPSSCSQQPQPLGAEELSKQMKEQLELLKSAKRGLSLVEDASNNKPRQQSVDEPKKIDVAQSEQLCEILASAENARSSLQAEVGQGTLYECEKEQLAPLDEQLTRTDDVSQNMESPEQKADQQSIVESEKTDDQMHVDLEEPSKSVENEGKPLTSCTITEEEKNADAQNVMEHMDCTNASEEEATPRKLPSNSAVEKSPAGGSKFLDMLMNKVRVKNFALECNFSANSTDDKANPDATADVKVTTDAVEKVASSVLERGNSEDSNEAFLGFDEVGHQPGMLLTPLVPQECQTRDGNAAFVSESLDEFMRKNNIRETPITPCKKLLEDDKDKMMEPRELDGLVTAVSHPPLMHMPAVPESLQKLRTVAERRQYLQRFSKNHKMAIINNEANVYRELQRKQRNLKVKAYSMMMLQSPNSTMPFTRSGWQAASYVATEHNYYYYQVIKVDGKEIKLPGSLGNNLYREKSSYSSKLTKSEARRLHCGPQCLDADIAGHLNVIKTKEQKVKLNKNPLPAVFRPCPLSQKPFQKPLDDDTAALLLAGGSMAVVSMPTVELEVQPQLGRPLDEIAKRYLQYILPHHDISNEWAEFSVSTLQQPSSVRAAEEEAAKAQAGRRKSFTFVIPYLNDRNHILVRRVVDRSEPLDATFLEDNKNLNNFEFRKALPAQTDELDLACADMLGDMINTVAISCSENSFVNVDPDRQDTLPSNFSKMDDEDSPKSDVKPKVGRSIRQHPITKQHRLRLELRRLNATIIDAAAKRESDNKPCGNEYCQMGCICESLGGELPMREHCGRADCVLECSCKRPEQTRIMRVETDGHGISNEDAFNLRRKATARLAKMEKEFTSTLVLTENETLLINESQSDKKRRCTKAPKRYEDSADIEDEQRISPHKRDTRSSTVGSNYTGNAVSNALKRSLVNIESTNSSRSTSQIQSTLSEPCAVKDVDAAKLMHCYVGLRRLPDMTNLATFCMTHQLYKCFCRGESLEGKPIVIEKESPNTTTMHFAPDVATRAYYSFERPPIEPPLPAKPTAVVVKSTYKNATTVAVQPTVVKKTITPGKPTTEGTQCGPQFDIHSGYYNTNLDVCRRTVSIPRNFYLRQNRRRAARIRQQISLTETTNTQIRLTNYIMGAVRFYRAELDQQRIEQSRQQKVQQTGRQTALTSDSAKTGKASGKHATVPPVIVVRDDSDEGVDHHMTSSKKPAKQPSLSRKRVKLTHREEYNKRAKHTYERGIKTKKIEASVSRSQLNGPSTSAAAATSPMESDIQMPRIAACFSLNTAAINLPPPGAEKVAEGLESSIVAVDGDNEGNGSNGGLAQDTNFRTFYNEVVKNMNSLVSKKMQDIDLALQRESKIIPSPNEEILCIIKWTNFLAAYESDFVYIWEVKMKNYNFMAATTTNMMPSVCGALGVINISALDFKTLPMMARMLIRRVRSESTRRLAVVMQGRQQYWLVKGFLRHMEGNACTKPTPQSHPLLTKKINVLCSLLVKQRIREHQRKLTQNSDAKSETSTTPPTTSSTPPSPSLLSLVDSQLMGSVTAANASKLTALKSPLTPNSTSSSSSSKSRGNLLSKKSVPVTSVSSSNVAGTTNAPTVASKTVGRVNAAAPDDVSKKDDHGGFNIRTNIEFRKVNQMDVHELQIPELHADDHRWVVLDLFEDFSHIFVPAFKDMISLDRIHNVMEVAFEKQKVVKLQFFQDAPYDAFVTPISKRKIYFGPLRLDMAPPVLVLLQSVDGKMMLREVYQREHVIPVHRERRTMAFWVLHVSGQVHFEIDVNKAAPMPPAVKTALLSMLPPLAPVVAGAPNAKSDVKSKSEPEDDDDDCVIIDDTKSGHNHDDYTGVNNADINIKSEKANCHGEQKQAVPRLSFTISSSVSGNLRVKPVQVKLGEKSAINIANQLPQNVVAASAAVGKALPANLGGGFVPFIAKVPASIEEDSLPSSLAANLNTKVATTLSRASATPQFLTPQVQLTQTLAPLNPTDDKTRSNSLSDGPPPLKISRISVLTNKVNEPLQKLLGTNVASKAGVQISKVEANNEAKSGIKITPSIGTSAGVKRTAGGAAKISKVTSTTTTTKPAINAPPLSGPIILKQTSTTISLGNLPPMRPAVTKVRKSLPAQPSKHESHKQEIPKQPPEQLPRQTPKQPPKQIQDNNESNHNAKVSVPAPSTSPEAKPAKEYIPETCSYGFLLSSPPLPRYRVKIVGGDFLIKVPNIGILRFKDCDSAVNFINKQLARSEEYRSLVPCAWRFVVIPPTKKDSSNHNNDKTTTPTTATAVVPAVTAVKPQTTSTAVATSIKSSTCTTEAAILIED